MKVVITLIFCMVAACSSTSGQQPSVNTPPRPKPVTAAELMNLRWIEGSWKGTGDIDKPFYERYKFENDTTLLIESADDESFSKITDATRYELKDGAFGKFGEGSQWVATAFDQDSITSRRWRKRETILSGNANRPTFGKRRSAGRSKETNQPGNASIAWTGSGDMSG